MQAPQTCNHAPGQHPCLRNVEATTESIRCSSVGNPELQGTEEKQIYRSEVLCWPNHEEGDVRAQGQHDAEEMPPAMRDLPPTEETAP